MKIEKVTDRQDFSLILEVWEASVRATHDFLSEDDIQYYKENIRDHYLDAVTLFAVRNMDGVIQGFMGTSEDSIEMLFVDPEAQGRGIGRLFVEHAVSSLNIRKVDVNEQNDKAFGFYTSVGFGVAGRSPVDGEGKPYPILHLEL